MSKSRRTKKGQSKARPEGAVRAARRTALPPRADAALAPAPSSGQARWGPDNPHPLSTMKTELVWEGKYDEWGNRRTVDTAGLAMPMQKIETIDQPRSEAAAAGDLPP